MIIAIGLTAIVLTAAINDAAINDADADFIARVEKTEWLDSTGKPVPVPRVERDDDGNVKTLRLSGMQLSADDFAAIGRIKTLRNLDLFRTNVADADLRQLRELPHLRGLNVSSTGISDAAIDEIIKLESLESLCLGDVAITPKAVARLKEHFRARGKQLALGYYQKK